MPRDTPILVTGSHRSGSTWVGQMLAAGSEVGYIREPFSILHRPGVLAVRFAYWFPYVCHENEQAYVQPVRDMLAYRYHTGAALRGARTPVGAAKIANDVLTFSRYRRAGLRPLLKEGALTIGHEHPKLKKEGCPDTPHLYRGSLASSYGSLGMFRRDGLQSYDSR